MSRVTKSGPVESQVTNSGLVVSRETNSGPEWLIVFDWDNCNRTQETKSGPGLDSRSQSVNLW